MKKLPLYKTIIFSFLPLVFCIITVELALRIFFSQHHIPISNYLAISDGFNFIQQKYQNYKIIKEFSQSIGYNITLEELGQIEGKLHEELYKEEHIQLLQSFYAEYEDSFKQLISEVEAIGSKLVVVYIPSNYADTAMQQSQKQSEAFFQKLTQKYGIDFIDVTPSLSVFSIDKISLLPYDSHLSPFGNQTIAQALSPYIERVNNYRSSYQFQESHSNLFGDCPPNINEIIHWHKNLPFQLICNSQGLRMDYNLTFPKNKQRVLVLGDSFAFGPYVKNEDAFPNILNGIYKDKEILNAGWPGYTIIDEVSLFNERAKYVEPDIVILQVLHNDIYGLYAVMKNVFSREKTIHNKIFRPSLSMEDQIVKKIIKGIPLKTDVMNQ